MSRACAHIKFTALLLSTFLEHSNVYQSPCFPSLSVAYISFGRLRTYLAAPLYYWA
jgi:hypothetical protein